MTKTIIAILAVGIATTASAERLQIGTVPFKAAVRVSDLDLGSEQGRAKALERSSIVAERVCGSLNAPSADSGRTRAACYAAFAQAVTHRLQTAGNGK